MQTGIEPDGPSQPGSNEGAEGTRLPGIARESVRGAIEGGASPPPRFERGFLASSHPVFVTIRGECGELRGCIGTLVAKCRDVAEETWRMAREAAFSDSRFQPVHRGELPRLRFEVSVVHPLEDVTDAAPLDPRRYGVVVSTSDGRRGALLPAIEGIDTVSQQLSIARRKGAIGPDEKARVQRFEVGHFPE